MAPQTEERTDRFACDVPGCGRTFSRVQGLTRHKRETHDAPDPPPKSSRADRISENLREIAEPLRKQRNELDAEIIRAVTELRDLREARARVDAVLTRLDPSFAKKKKTSGPNGGMAEKARKDNDTKVEAVRRYLEANADALGEGFTSTDLFRDVPAWDISTPTIGKSKMVDILQQLRDDDFVRLDRMIRGGGKLYKLVGGSPNGASPTT